MADTLFISDLHLSEATPDIEAGLRSFLAQEKGAEALYILGDLFEAWIGDDDDSPLATRISDCLRTVSASGTRLYLVRGNRDFLLGEAFAGAVGGTLLGDSTAIELNGRPALILHGDTLCTDDIDYQRFRALVHSPAWQNEMLAKPLPDRRAMAQQLRAMSADAASNKAEDIMDVNADAVAQAMAGASVDLLIHGHTHRPAVHDVPSGQRYVLGDWSDTTGWCLRANEDGLTLESFEFSALDAPSA